MRKIINGSLNIPYFVPYYVPMSGGPWKKKFLHAKTIIEWVHKNTIELQSLKNENF